MIDINIELQEAFEMYKIKDLIELEKKLYLISLYLDNMKAINISSLSENDEIKIFKEISFRIINRLDKEDVIDFSGIIYHLSKYRRIINFNNDDNSEKIFVYNLLYFIEKLKEKEFNLFECSGTNKSIYSIDSLKSKLNQNEIKNIYENETIIEIKKIETNTKKLLEKFNSKSRYPRKIFDLSLNMKYYNNNTMKNKIEYYEDLVDFRDDKIINNFIFNDFANILYFYGPKGCGKTTYLLFSSLDIHNYQGLNNPRIYIDYQLMKENSLLRKLIFKIEMFYMAQTVEELSGLFDLKYHRRITEINPFFLFFKTFLENIIKSNKLKKTLIVIIDNYDDLENNDENNNDLQKIIELAKNNSKLIKLIISGNGSFIKGKQKLFINNDLFETFASDCQICLECPTYNHNNNQSIKKNIIPEYIYSNPEYYFRFISKEFDEKNILEFENVLLEEEEGLCKNINFFGIYYSLIYENKELSYKKFNQYYDMLPNYFLTFIKNSKTISFKISNLIFKNALKKTIEYDIEVKSIENLLKLYNKEKTQIGIYEEKLLTLFLKFNKLNLFNLQFSKENILEVEEIYEFINSKYDRYNGVFQKNKPILITQANYKGKNYDLLLLIPLEHSDNYFAIFIQIGLNKKKADIIKLVNDILNNHNKYKKGIEKYLGINIKDIYLNFIFDKETQQNNIENGIHSCGSNYCLLHNIKFYLFSLEDYQLYKLNNDMSYEKITYYEYNDEKGNILGNKRVKFSNSMFIDFYSILDEDEVEKIISIKPIIKNIKKYLVYNINSENVSNKTLNKDHLYIFINYYSDDKIFGIDGELKIFSNGNFIDYVESIPSNVQLRMYDISLS